MTEYVPNQAESNFLTKPDNGEKKPFGINSKRFLEKEQVGPEMTAYNLPESCTVQDPNMMAASNRSKVEKGLTNMIIGKDNPGVGEYDTQHLKTIANKEF